MGQINTVLKQMPIAWSTRGARVETQVRCDNLTEQSQALRKQNLMLGKLRDCDRIP